MVTGYEILIRINLWLYVSIMLKGTEEFDLDNFPIVYSIHNYRWKNLGSYDIKWGQMNIKYIRIIML